MSICVCVRKRPLFEKEEKSGEIDIVTSCNPKTVVHDCKLRVDGITKYIESAEFKFDNSYSETESGDAVYEFQLKPLLPNLFKGGVVTCFAYGQTGSGKTHTVSATTKLAIHELYEQAGQTGKQLATSISFFEIYGGKLADLLNNKKKL